METFSVLLALCAGNSPVYLTYVQPKFPRLQGSWGQQGANNTYFDVFFDLGLNKRLSKQSWGWWFETRSRTLWRHCNVDNTVHERRNHIRIDSTQHSPHIYQCDSLLPYSLAAGHVIDNSWWQWPYWFRVFPVIFQYALLDVANVGYEPFFPERMIKHIQK